MSAESRKNNMSKIETIDVLLPQTQCELCTYKGCRPYAEAIVNDNECIDRCEPGGVETLKAIADIMQQNRAEQPMEIHDVFADKVIQFGIAIRFPVIVEINITVAVT